MITALGSQLLFWILAVLLVGGAICVVMVRNILHAAVALAFTMLVVAGFFFMLSAPYLGVVQIMIYAAGVSILVLMTVMVTRRALKRPIAQTNEQVGLGAVIVFGAFLPLLIAVLLNSDYPAVTSDAAIGQALTDASLLGLTETLFTKFVLPFEIASILLLVALIGAVVIAKEARPEK